jgi:Tol biopolymer transport system component
MSKACIFAAVVCVLALPAGCEKASGPSGRIVFNSYRDGNSEIYAINPDGSGLERLTDNEADDTCPAWPPDGTRIAFVSSRDGNEEIYVVRADGSDLRLLTRDGSADNWPTWTR